MLQTFSGERRALPVPDTRLRLQLALGRMRLNWHMFWKYATGGRSADFVRSRAPMLCEGAPPATIGIEFTNACQLRCPYCDPQNATIRRPAGLMSAETFANVLKQLAELRVRNIRMVGGGEPTLHPEFSEWIQALRPIAPFTSAGTNGQRLTEAICKAMLRALDVIEISVDSDNVAGYEQSRLGGRFDALMSNLKRLRALKLELKSKTLIHIRVMLRPSEESVRPRMLKYWSQFADTLSTQMLKDYFGSCNDLYPLSESPGVPRCVAPFKLMGVNWNGDVPLCHASAYQLREPRGLLLGNVNSATLSSMWRGATIEQYRQGHRWSRPDLTPICRGCHDARSPRVWWKVYDGRVEPQRGRPVGPFPILNP